MVTKIKAVILAISLALASVVPIAGTAQAAVLDQFLQHKTFPECHDVKVLGSMIERFNWAEEKTWHRGIYLTDIQRVETRLEEGTNRYQIPRRYCRGHARLSNGRHPTVWYLIEGGQGFAGNKFHVRFCVNGFDRWNENDGSCRLLRY